MKAGGSGPGPRQISHPFKENDHVLNQEQTLILCIDFENNVLFLLYNLLT